MKEIVTILLIYFAIVTAIIYGIDFSSKGCLILVLVLLTSTSILIFDYWISKTRNLKSIAENIKEKSVTQVKSFITKYIILGKDLDTSLNEVISKLSENEKPTIDNYSNLAGSIIRRITRSGAVVILLTIIPTLISLYILHQQNKLIGYQNEIQARQLRVQEFQIERERNNEYNIQVQEILNSVNKNDTIKMDQIHSIASFTKFIEPPSYDLNTNDNLKTPISKAKSDLLLGLTDYNSSNREIGQILLLANFHNSDFRHLNFSDKKFRWLKSENSNFSGTVISDVDFRESILNGSTFVHSWLTGLNLSGAKMSRSNLMESHNYHCEFIGVDFSYSDFREANFHNCFFAKKEDDKIYLPNLSNVKVSESNWFEELKGESNIGVHYLEEKYRIDTIMNNDYCGQYYLIKEKL